jgi:hypothetical protein
MTSSHKLHLYFEVLNALTLSIKIPEVETIKNQIIRVSTDDLLEVFSLTTY